MGTVTPQDAGVNYKRRHTPPFGVRPFGALHGGNSWELPRSKRLATVDLAERSAVKVRRAYAMSAKAIELILMRQLASSLAMPIFLVDADGTLVFYNEPAERVLGMRFEETGEMPVREWSTLWEITECDGRPVAPDRLPLMIAFGERRPVHSELWIRGLDGTRRRIGATAFPLIRMDQLLGAVAIFWETAP
jgi:PAS domain-containing protein